jgi:NAD-dependent dihydropyrimidine dehydrogenase PreA subunit
MRRSIEEATIMAHVIVDTCTKDALCVDVCPNESIHPTKDEAGFDAATQLNINPDDCLDCGACVSVCPTNSILPADELPNDKKDFAEKNADFF